MTPRTRQPSSSIGQSIGITPEPVGPAHSDEADASPPWHQIAPVDQPLAGLDDLGRPPPGEPRTTVQLGDRERTEAAAVRDPHLQSATVQFRTAPQRVQVRR
jgi:hypothetical protein